MTEGSFDPTGAVRFDLPRGSIHTGNGEAAVLVPLHAIDVLARTAPRATAEAFASALGASIGKRVRAELDEPTHAPLSTFATHFAGALAIAGCGAATVARWGRAMVIVFEPPTLPSPFLSWVVRGALHASTGRDLDAVPLFHTETQSNHLIVSRKTAATARAWLDDGVSWGDVLTRLQTSPMGAP